MFDVPIKFSPVLKMWERAHSRVSIRLTRALRKGEFWHQSIACACGWCSDDEETLQPSDLLTLELLPEGCVISKLKLTSLWRRPCLLAVIYRSFTDFCAPFLQYQRGNLLIYSNIKNGSEYDAYPSLSAWGRHLLRLSRRGHHLHSQGQSFPKYPREARALITPHTTIAEAVNAEHGEGENSLMEQEHIPGQERRIAEVLSLRTFHNAASFMSIMRQSNWRSLWPLQQHKREAFRWSSSGDLLPHIKTLGETPQNPPTRAAKGRSGEMEMILLDMNRSIRETMPVGDMRMGFQPRALWSSGLCVCSLKVPMQWASG
jgi:hypothetical protein